MDLTHLHLLLNHFPTVGMIIGLGLLLFSLMGKSNDLKRASLVVFLGIGLLTIAVFITGSVAQSTICEAATATAPCKDANVSKPLIGAHEGAALVAFGVMEILAAFAWLGLWQMRRLAHLPNWNLGVVLLLAAATFGLMARAANIGGEIRHPEIWVNHIASTGEPFGREIGNWVIATRWVWPACETLHFIGLALLFGVAAVVDMRMLGLLKSVSFNSLHRLLPWGILGFGINMITGMLFFIGAPEQYTHNPVFEWKVILMMLTGINVLYFTIFDEPWEVGSGQDAPMISKAIAASALVLVLGVLYCGRMLPFLGNAF